ncbi:MAG TPA: complex I subunit 5 family protein [Trebonia sp.]|nr:complex I subunit 5 family protein [Trebonia sp.]
MTGGAIPHFLPLMIVIPVISACFLVAAGRYLPRRLSDILATGTAAGVTALAAVVLAHAAHGGRVISWMGGWQPAHGLSVGIPLIADPMSAGLALLAGGLVTCALLYSWQYIDTVDGRFYALMLLFLAGMEGFAISGDVFDMFVFFELMGAAAYALTGMKIEDETAVQGGLIFGVINSLGAYLSLAGVAILYSRYGQLGLPQLGAMVRHQRPDALIIVAFTLILTGFVVKAALVPFHFWLADAHAVAPSPVCVIFSGIMVELGVYGVARVYWTVFSGSIPHQDVTRAFVVLGTVTAVTGAVMCFMQRHLKRLLAYSTIAHVGLFITGFATLSDDGTAGAALYVAGHAGVKSALFLLVGILLDKYGNVDEHRLHGRGRKDRLPACLYLAAALGLAGLPPFGLALGKSVAEDAVVTAGYAWGPVLFIAVSALTGGAALRAGLRVYFGLGPRPALDSDNGTGEETTGAEEKPETTELVRTPVTMLAAVGILLAGALAAGVVPDAGQAFAGAAQRLTDAAGYIGQALYHARATPVRPDPAVAWTGAGTGLDFLSAGLALALAFLAIYAQRLPGFLHRAVRPARPVLATLHRVHSGHIGDYVAWLFLGVAAVTALLGLPLL